MEEKLDELYHICKQLSNIPRICNGGCGIAAYSLYVRAKELLPDEDIKIIYSYAWTGEYEDNLPVVESNDISKAHSPSHCYITVNGERVDVSDNDLWDKRTVASTEEFLFHSITKATWNSSFDRNEWIPEIEQITGVDLNFAY